MRTHHSALGGVALALALTLTGCSDDDPTADPTPPTTPPTTASSSPTESTSPTTEPETPKQKAVRLASAQTKAFVEALNRLSKHPNRSMAVLEDYLRDMALADNRDYIKGFRGRGEHQVGDVTLTKLKMGPDGVVFRKSHPQVTVDLQVCYDLGDTHVVDSDGNVVPPGPGVVKVGQARYAIYAESWPSDSPSDWRIGKQIVAGDPCTL